MTEKSKTIEIMLPKEEFEKLKIAEPNDRIIFEAEGSYECFTIYYLDCGGEKMTNEEALNLFKDHEYMTDFSWQDEMSEIAIDAIEKQIAKKPLIRYENMGLGISPNESFKVYGCPCCKEEIDEETSFCQNCGQKIDFEEGESE